MKHENKWKRRGKKVLLALDDKTLKKIWRKTTKILLWCLDWSNRERKSFKKVWIVKNMWETKVYKTLYTIFDCLKIRFDWLKIPSIDPKTIKNRSKHTEPNQNFNCNFDQSRNRFDRLKFWKKQFFEKTKQFYAETP